MNRIKTLSFLLLTASINLLSAQTFQTNSDFWAAADALQRKLPGFAEAGEKRSNKFVGMFYWTWHTDNLADWVLPDGSIANITEIIAQNPEAEFDPNHAAWQNVWDGGVFWWDEPLFGYYRTTDEWVLRKHAELLADAGIDVVFFDCTNGSYTWQSSYAKLLQVWQQARLDGVKTPQIAFLLNFSATADSRLAISEIYQDIYRPGNYRDLWFNWKGKPLIMAYPDNLHGVAGDKAGMQFHAEKAFTGIDVSCPSWSNDIGNLTLRLFRWDGLGYASTVNQSPLYSQVFANFKDNQSLRLNFPALEAGDYVWELSDASEIVGVWKYADSDSPAVCYFNGNKAIGDYVSSIFYAPDSQRVLLSSGSSTVPVQLHEGVDAALMQEIKSFFTFRPGQPDYTNGPSRNDHWAWLETTQHGYVGSVQSGFEQTTVGVAQNASEASRGKCVAFNSPDTYGRSYTEANGQDTSATAFYYGANFQEQWNRAFEIDPELIFVTGWNEWIAGRWKNWAGCANVPFEMAFPDLYSAEKSRDIEMVKSWGDKGDAYYLQLVANVRRFKGMEAQEPVSAPKTISMRDASDWHDVRPDYFHYKNNTGHRDHAGQGSNLVYRNDSGRNDIVQAKVARDAAFVYFYVATQQALTPRSDSAWMRLFIDVDREKITGWEGYDLVVNRNSPTDSAVVERSAQGWQWTKAAASQMTVSSKTVELKLPRSLFPQDKPLNFEFKWSDNMQDDGNIMDFYVSGDVAPGGRFNFVYDANPAVGVLQSNAIPTGFKLYQNYPNPFNSTTKITFFTPINSCVKIDIFSLSGRNIATLTDSVYTAGEHQIAFNGRGLASGMYLLRMRSGQFFETRKMVYLH
ncbi:MAG: T9SS type A sorting domain-containing protein [Deferribacteres bacterium]|nr:T9SS type A sorting domain-containing protein [candidate division KSB1 bacterium]MCB9502728.1 T9SS type A sorting domain-containing protein [Deferribacteres bacterium]